jgi:hypothetical protein
MGQQVSKPCTNTRMKSVFARAKRLRSGPLRPTLLQVEHNGNGQLGRYCLADIEGDACLAPCC